MNDNDYLAKILNKEEFIVELTQKEVPLEKIEEEWQKITKMFTLLYLQIAYNDLSESDRAGLAQQLSENPTASELEKFTTKMTEFLSENPNSVHQKSIIEKAAKETLDRYVISLKEE